GGARSASSTSAASSTRSRTSARISAARCVRGASPARSTTARTPTGGWPGSGTARSSRALALARIPRADGPVPRGAGRAPAQVRRALHRRRGAGGHMSAEAAALAVAGERPLLTDSVVVLTGASGGIGRSIARMLVAAGAALAVTDLLADQV